jgi:outer membrane lipoprotein-sorting protein
MIKSLKMMVPTALMLTFVLVASGCTAGQQVSASDIINKMQDTLKNTQTSQSTVDLSLTLNKDGIKALAQTLQSTSGANGSGNSGDANNSDWASKLPDSVSGTVKVWKQSPDKARVELANSSLPGVGGTVAVYDGQKFYAYTPANNTYYTGTPDKMNQLPDQLKQAMQNGDLQQQLNDLIAQANVQLLGSEKVAGLEAYKLDITPKPGAVDNLNLPTMVKTEAGMLIKDLHATLWVDKDRWIPLKLTVDHPSLGQFSYTATQVALNQPIDASQFTLQAPAGAKVVDLDQVKSQLGPATITLPQARDAATKEGWKLLEPSYVTNNATLVDVKQLDGKTMSSAKTDASALILSYSAPDTNFTIVEGKGLGDIMSRGMGQSTGNGSMGMGLGMMGGGAGQISAQDVKVRGVTAKAFTSTDGNWTALAWTENGTNVFVAIMGNVPLAEATKIAEGLK